MEHQQFELHQGQRSPKEFLLLLPTHGQGRPLASVYYLNYKLITLTWRKTGSVQPFISLTNSFPSKFLLDLTYCAVFQCTAQHSFLQGLWSPAEGEGPAWVSRAASHAWLRWALTLQGATAQPSTQGWQVLGKGPTLQGYVSTVIQYQKQKCIHAVQNLDGSRPAATLDSCHFQFPYDHLRVVVLVQPHKKHLHSEVWAAHFPRHLSG